MLKKCYFSIYMRELLRRLDGDAVHGNIAFLFMGPIIAVSSDTLVADWEET